MRLRRESRFPPQKPADEYRAPAAAVDKKAPARGRNRDTDCWRPGTPSANRATVRISVWRAPGPGRAGRRATAAGRRAAAPTAAAGRKAEAPTAAAGRQAEAPTAAAGR